jgi:DNA repair REX1-B
MVLQTGNMTIYPDTCSKATASFSVLSETIKAIQNILRVDRARSDLVKLVTQLQDHERKKLQLTAAYHLERIRQKNHHQMVIDQSQQNEDDLRIERLLNGGVQSLHDQISSCVDGINETIDEIRMIIVEE